MSKVQLSSLIGRKIVSATVQKSKAPCGAEADETYEIKLDDGTYFRVCFPEFHGKCIITPPYGKR